MFSKRYREAEKLVDRKKEYSIADAVDTLKKMPPTKFDESVDLSCNLNVDPKQTDQIVRGSVVLPHGTGKKVRILVFCDHEKEAQAKEAGADHIGSDQIVDKILKEGWAEFDCCIATPGMMKVVSKLGKVLGPRGLMPSPKTGTVTDNVAFAIGEAKRGKIDFRMDKFSCIHISLGKISFAKNALLENINTFIDAVVASQPNAVKSELIKSLYLSTTMSPSLKIAL